MHIKPILAAGIIAATFATQALTLAVKDVKIAQRYPWNGLVDIDYTVECDDKDADVYVYPVGYDKDYNLTEPIWTLTGEGANGQAVKAGKHRMTWDMAKDKGANYNRAAYSIKMHAYAGAAPYLVVDLAAGSNAEKYPISYMSEMPGETWPEEYKTTKLVLKLIPAGTFMMGDGSTFNSDTSSSYGYDNFKRGGNARHKVTLTQPFYCGVFEVSYQQWKLITGEEKMGYSTKTLSTAVRSVNYNDLRGSTLGAAWPAHQQVDASSFLGKLRSRTGVTFDVPTEAQWEYACRANSQGDTIPNPNSFGIYGMNAIPGEWCLDWFAETLSGTQTDPKGPSSGYKGARVVRGGAYGYTTESYSYTWSGNSYRYSDIYSYYCMKPSARFYYSINGYTTPDFYCSSYEDLRDGRRIAVYSFGCRLVALPAAK